MSSSTGKIHFELGKSTHDNANLLCAREFPCICGSRSEFCNSTFPYLANHEHPWKNKLCFKTENDAKYKSGQVLHKNEGADWCLPEKFNNPGFLFQMNKNELNLNPIKGYMEDTDNFRGNLCDGVSGIPSKDLTFNGTKFVKKKNLF